MQARLLPVLRFAFFCTFFVISFHGCSLADHCSEIKEKLTQEQLKIDQASTHLYLPCCKPGLPSKPLKDAEVQKEIDALQKVYSQYQHELDTCNRPPAVPKPTVQAFTSTGVPDPQVAVGRRFVVTASAGSFEFFSKSTLQPVSPAPEGTNSFQTMFTSLFKRINEGMDMPKWLCDPDHPELKFKDAKHKLIQGNFGCIGESYDGRVIYDDVRHRFWLATALRPFLWFCTDANQKEGLETKGPKGVVWDPDPSDPSGKTALCHTDWDLKWMHRFAAVAISKTDSAGNEDLSKPFHLYVLTETLGDWPQITVNANHLVINHFDTQHPTEDPIEIFNAEDLANGVQADTVLKVKPVKTIPLAKLIAKRDGKDFPAGAQTFPVNIHGSSERMTYLVSSTGNNLLIFGVRAPAGDPSGEPKMLTGAAVDLGHPISGVRNNPVYRDGKIYIADFDCQVPLVSSCLKYSGRIVVVPVRPSDDGESIRAEEPPSAEFMDYRIGAGKKDFLSIENAMVEVTKDEDMVYAYEETGLMPGRQEPGSIKYRVFYHGSGNITEAGTLKAQEGSKLPDPPDPGHEGAVVDLGGIALDPSDEQTVWIANAFSNKGEYTEAAGAVKP